MSLAQSHVYQKTSKVQVSKQLETYIDYLTKGPISSLNNKLNNIIRIKHRRKNHNKDNRKSFMPTSKKSQFIDFSHQGRISCYSGTLDRQSVQKHVKRNTYHVDGEQQKSQTNIGLDMKSKSRKRIQISLFQESVQDRVSTKNIVFRCTDKTEEKQQPKYLKKLFRKTSKQFNKTTANFTRNIQGEPLVQLISKFKFENLKTVSKIDPENHEKVIQYSKMLETDSNQKIQLMPQLKGSHLKPRKSHQRTITNKTAMNWKQKSKAASRSSNVQALSPWQNDTIEVFQVSQFY